MSCIFDISNVNKIYGTNKIVQVKALTDVSVKIFAGEFTAIVGPSGSGKSTMLNIISGLDTPSSGNILLSGKDISKMGGNELSDFRRDHIGFIFQAYNLLPVLTCGENIEYIMLLQGISKKERIEKVRSILKDVGLSGMEKRFPRELSGGQQQRVAIARAMVSNPDIILADEPTANLDSKTGSDLVEMMRELNKLHSLTFVFSTHDPKIMKRAKRLLHLRDGKIVQDEIKEKN